MSEMRRAPGIVSPTIYNRIDAMLYAITDRRTYAENEHQARQRLLKLAETWASNGVAYIQLREKDLPARDLVELARAMLHVMRAIPHSTTRLLINSRPDVALAAGADGVHLPSGPAVLTPNEIRGIFTAASCSSLPTISISCHTLQEVKTARHENPDCILFAPVFEKQIVPESTSPAGTPRALPGTGLDLLRQACRIAAPIPVFALGGVTAQNAARCLKAGASGIAGIRLFQEPASVWRDFV